MFPMQCGSRRSFLKFSSVAFGGVGVGLSTCPVPVQAADPPRFELSLHQYSLKKLFDAGELDLLGYGEFAKNTLGISNIEFAAEFCQELVDSADKAEAVLQRSRQVGVKHRALLCADGPALDAQTAEDRSVALKEHMRWAKVAEQLGCEYLRVRASTGGDRQQQLNNAVSGISRLCDALSSKASPVSVLIENVAGFSRDPQWLVEVVERIGPERVGLIADFGNFDGDIYEGMKQLLPHTRSVCTKSWEFDEAGNETKIDFARMMKIIRDSEFHGCIAIEYLGEEPVAGIRQTAALVKRYSGV